MNGMRRLVVVLLTGATSIIGVLPIWADGRSRPPGPMRNILSWQTGSLLGWEPVKELNLDIFHTLPKPESKDDIHNGGIKPVAMIQEAIDSQWRSEVEALHALGTKVWATVPSTGFVPERFEQYGMDPEIYFARTPEGEPAPMLGGSYGSPVMTSCYNNPHWFELIGELVHVFQNAGFDGVWFDVGGYADKAVYFCHCEHCTADWRTLVAQLRLPDETPQPTHDGGYDFSRKVNREHFRWRMDQWEENFRAIRDAALARNPEFMFTHNSSATSYHLYLVGARGLYDLPHLEEWGHSAAPYSLLPSYLLGRAMSPGQPPVLVQNDKPKRNRTQHRIFLAEAYAAGGVPQNSREAEETGRFYEYLDVHGDAYIDMESMAEVAVLTSFWSRFFYEIGDRPSHAAPRPQYWMGWLLQDMHIPYDYLIAEKDLSLETLRRYKLIILADLAVIDDAHIKLIRDYLESGGRVLATGNTAKYDLEMQDLGVAGLIKLAGLIPGTGQKHSVGEGRFVYLDDSPARTYADANPRDLNEKESLEIPGPPPATFASAIDWLLEGQRSVSLQAKNTTAVVPQRQDGRILLHLINYNMYPDGAALTPDTQVRATVALPPGTSVSRAKAVSPDWTGYERSVSLKVDGGRADVTLEELSTHAVIILELREN